MILRNMDAADIPVGLRLCRHAQWNQVARDWEMFLKMSPNGCRVAQLDTVVGTVATVRYQDHFSWIAMVLVDPEFQRMGIGMHLLLESLDILKNEETIKLDASLPGRQLYLKLNFVDEYSLSRMIRPIDQHSSGSSRAEVLHKTDFDELIKMDARVFGADRRDLLEWLFEGASHLAFVIKEFGEVRGYCFGRIGEHYVHIGPVVASRAELASELVLAALNNCIGQSVLIDIPHFDSDWMKWLESIGFEEQRPFYRMYLGTNRFAGIPEHQFAILGPEFG